LSGVKTVGVRDLKIHLSAYLRDVARGDVILVTDRSRVVAELRQPGEDNRGASPTPEALLRERLVERGLLRQIPPLSRTRWRSPLPRLLKRGTAQELLDAEREDRST
jgi:antitoxin (DNA-binding transcriptional repressor) of toxin-antitoxin stability system